MFSFQILGIVSLLIIGVKNEPIGRVVNGANTSIESYPFMISLRTSEGSHSCGGSIIAPNFVLTAAHCTFGRSAINLSIQYGVTVIDANGPNVIQVKRIIQHKGFKPLISLDNDISLLEVEQPFPINFKTVAFISLPKLYFETPQTPEGGPGVLTGWGLNGSGGFMMTHLQEVDLKIYSDDECQFRHRNRTSTNQICGGVDEGGKGQCSADSGGPLFYKEGNQLIQVGIVSWSVKPCTVAPYPGVYTKVSKYVDWIMQNMIVSN